MNPKFVLLYSPLFSYYLELTQLPFLLISLKAYKQILSKASIIVFLFLPFLIFLPSCLSLKPLPPTPGFNFQSVLLSHHACLLFQFLVFCFQLHSFLCYLLTCRPTQTRTCVLRVSCSVSVTYSRSTVNIY